MASHSDVPNCGRRMSAASRRHLPRASELLCDVLRQGPREATKCGTLIRTPLAQEELGHAPGMSYTIGIYKYLASNENYRSWRPQDSIPFLRRVSADLQKSEHLRSGALFEHESAIIDDEPAPEPEPAQAPRAHSLVKTTFHGNGKHCIPNPAERVAHAEL